MKKLWNEFKEFAVKGDAITLAVGVIIGGAFGKIVSSIVSDILTPLLSLLTGGMNFSDKTVVLRAATEMQEALTLKWGLFLQNVIDFLIIAICVFFMVKSLSLLKRKKNDPSDKKSDEPTKEVQLLGEIRDLLKGASDEAEIPGDETPDITVDESEPFYDETQE